MEDGDATRAHEQPEDDEDDAPQQLAAHQRDDAGDHQHHGEQPQKKRHAPECGRGTRLTSRGPDYGRAVTDDPATEYAVINEPPNGAPVQLTAWQPAPHPEQRRWLVARVFHERRNDHQNARLHARAPGAATGGPVDPFAVYDMREHGRSRPHGPGYGGIELYPPGGIMAAPAEGAQLT